MEDILLRIVCISTENEIIYKKDNYNDVSEIYKQEQDVE